MSINRNILVLAAIVLLMLAFLGGFCCYEATTSNIWNASCVGDIPVPNGFDRVEAPTGSYTEYLRSIPLKEKGYKLHLHSGQVAKHQVLAAAVVDQPLLNQNEQCADVAMRLRAEYLWKNGCYDEIRFTTVHDTVMRYRPDTTHAYSMRFYFEEYLAEVFKWCNTGSLYNETVPRDFIDVQPGDILVHPAEPGEKYGHAIVVADVARNAKGKVAILCMEGSTPAREKHIVRNLNLLRNPWFVIDEYDTHIKFIKSRFRQGQLRHY